MIDEVLETDTTVLGCCRYDRQGSGDGYHGFGVLQI